MKDNGIKQIEKTKVTLEETVQETEKQSYFKQS